MKIIGELVLLCVSLMRPALSASLRLHGCPLKEQRGGAVALQRGAPALALILFVCHLALSQSFALVQSSNSNRPDTDTVCALRAQFTS